MELFDKLGASSIEGAHSGDLMLPELLSVLAFAHFHYGQDVGSVLRIVEQEHLIDYCQRLELENFRDVKPFDEIE